jgi:hypothetical protein
MTRKARKVLSRNSKMVRQSRWFAGLADDIELEIRRNITQAKKVGKDTTGWRDVPKRKRIHVNKPLFPGFTMDESTGRSDVFQKSVVEKMVIRHELGATLWDDSLNPPDTESFEGTPLNDGERDFITKVLAVRDSHLEKNRA